MSQEKEKKEKKENTATEAIVPFNSKPVKEPWTVQRCLKAARRFDSTEEWSKGHPSSYKAACSHGWLNECTAHMSKSKVVGLQKGKKVTPPKKLKQSA